MRYWNEVYLPMPSYEMTVAKGEITKDKNQSFIPNYF
jgi:hypothetical protein